MDVVPDEIRVQRREQRGDDGDGHGEKAASDLEDEHRGDRRDGDLHETDGLPTPPEDPVDRDQKPAVERLRVRRRFAGDVAERPVMHERQREAAALLGERVDDLAALVEKDGEPRHDRRRNDDRVRTAAAHAAIGSRVSA